MHLYFVLLTTTIIIAVFFGIRAYIFKKKFGDIKRRHSRVSFIIEHLNDGIIEYDSSFVVTRLNPAIEKLLGVTGNDVIGKKISPDDKNDPRLASLVQVIYSDKKTSTEKDSNKQYQAIEIQIQKPDQRNLKIFTIPKYTGSVSGPVGYIKIVRDVTREEIIAQNKTDLVALVSHQLRTPIAAIKWVFSALLDGDFGQLNTEQRQILVRGLEANEDMIMMIDDILDVSKIDKSDFKYTFEKADLVSFLKNIVETHTENAKSKGITLRESIRIDKMMASFDQKRLRIAITNLITNAINYSPPNSTVTVSFVLDGPQALISVQDKGIGIPTEERPHIFEKFYRAENAQKIKSRGTGLGLFLARSIIESHGGSISFDSEIGSGTTFYVRIPIDKEF